MSIRHRETKDNFSGGYNSRDREAHLQDTESPDMRNVMLGKRGGVFPRKGTELFRPVPVCDYTVDGEIPSVTSIYEHINRGGQNHILAFAGDQLKRANAADGWTLVADGFIFNSYFEFVSHPIINRSLFVNGFDGYWITDGITAYEVEPYESSHDEDLEIGESVLPENPSLISFYDNRVWLSGIRRTPTRVYFNVDDIEGNILYNYFTAWSWINIPSVRGENVTALMPFKGSLLVFTASTIRAITATEAVVFEGGFSYIPPSYTMREVSDNAGTVSQRTVKLMQDKIIFMGTDGVYVFDGATPPYKISHRVEPDIEKINIDWWSRVCAVVWGDKYILSAPIGERRIVTYPEGLPAVPDAPADIHDH